MLPGTVEAIPPLQGTVAHYRESLMGAASRIPEVLAASLICFALVPVDFQAARQREPLQQGPGFMEVNLVGTSKTLQ